MSSVFGTGRSANPMKDLFLSEHLWVNLSSRNTLYRLGYLMLIERSIEANLIMYVDVIVNQAEYQYEGNKSRKVRKFVYARSLSCIPISSTLYCYVKAEKILNKRKFKFNCRERIRQSIRKVRYRARRYFTLFSCNRQMYFCKNEAQWKKWFWLEWFQ